MKNVIVVESAKELVDLFDKNISTKISLKVGLVRDTWIGLDSDLYQIAPHVTFQNVFLELCDRMNIHVESKFK